MTATPTTRTTRPAGTGVERWGWVLVALLAAVMVVFGFEAYLAHESANQAINGSGCCTGHRLSEAPSWVYLYAQEMGKYMGTYMVGTGLFGLAVIFSGLRTARRWAWVVCWYVPLLFVIHGFALGSFPFDIVPLALTSLGQLLMIRPVFGRRVSVPTADRRAAPMTPTAA